jgi:hypothetical protein
MIPPVRFFAQPRFRASSPDFAKLQNMPAKFTLKTPGARLAVALTYYSVEVFATQADRDAACGPTAHPDVTYFSIIEAEIGAVEVDNIACGHALSHPHFEQVFAPLFEAAVCRLIDEVVQTPTHKIGPIADTTISIARARYTLQVIATRNWVHFDVHGLSLFERIDRDLMERTCGYLKRGLALHLSPLLLNAKAN